MDYIQILAVHSREVFNFMGKQSIVLPPENTERLILKMILKMSSLIWKSMIQAMSIQYLIYF